MEYLSPTEIGRGRILLSTEQGLGFGYMNPHGRGGPYIQKLNTRSQVYVGIMGAMC